eukprot:3711298-Amphidinium_carterae.1
MKLIFHLIGPGTASQSHLLTSSYGRVLDLLQLQDLINVRILWKDRLEFISGAIVFWNGWTSLAICPPSHSGMLLPDTESMVHPSQCLHDLQILSTPSAEHFLQTTSPDCAQLEPWAPSSGEPILELGLPPPRSPDLPVWSNPDVSVSSSGMHSSPYGLPEAKVVEVVE